MHAARPCIMHRMSRAFWLVEERYNTASHQRGFYRVKVDRISPPRSDALERPVLALEVWGALPCQPL